MLRRVRGTGEKGKVNSMSHLVRHVRDGAHEVYVGRGSKWGNPFRIGVDGDRDTVIAKYKSYFMANSRLLNDVHELHGKVLGCYCAPLACHADFLVHMAEAAHTLDREGN